MPEDKDCAALVRSWFGDTINAATDNDSDAIRCSSQATYARIAGKASDVKWNMAERVDEYIFDPMLVL